MARVSKRSFIFFRLSPAEEEQKKSYAIKQGEIKGRISAEYYRAKFRDVFERLHKKFPDISSLNNYVEVICGPFGSAITQNDYVEKGIPLLRISNISDEGGLEFSNLVFITHEKANKLSRYQVKANDIVISQRGSIGLPAVISNEYPVFNISANLIAIRNFNGLIPRYVQVFLSSKIGEIQISRLQSGQVHPKITTEDIEAILIPVVNNQHMLITAMDEARSQRKQKLAEADALLSGLDDYLLNTLGLEPPVKDERKVFAIQISSISGRFDPHFHAPNFKNIYRLLSKTTTKKLGEIVQFSKDSWNPKDEEKLTFRYIEISNVKPQTGEAIWTETLTKEAPSRARMLVHGDDIIVSLTRPHHGSIAHLSEEFDGCIASTGFAVIRSVSKLVNREYLWCILRSQLSLQQMLQRSSGGNYPAITKTELENIIIPIHEISIQEQIVAEIQRRRSESQRLRSEAESGWQAAKQWFEDQLLGGS